jgi:STE24 endopeptidase
MNSAYGDGDPAAQLLSWGFAAAVLAWLAVHLWLASRQVHHVARHRERVPAAFAGSVPAEAQRRAADYTIAKTRLSMLATAVSAAVLVGWTLLGGLDALNTALRGSLVPLVGTMGYQLALLGAVTLIGSALELPLAWAATFRLEQRFGFNRMSQRLWWLDQFKGAVVGAVVLLPLAALLLWLMGRAGTWWWLWAWVAWVGFNLLLMVIWPTLIAPWFNRFEPLADAALEARIAALLDRAGFRARGLFVMDGSRRSAHANAYFTGLGAAKRVVFFDTLLARLSPAEVEAVLAHELGHFRHHHVHRRLAVMFLASLLAFAAVGFLAQQPWFYEGLGAGFDWGAPNDALALVLFALAMPPLAFFVGPLLAHGSRRHEFEADAYACSQADGRALASALLKLHEDNASTLTPDPIYARFYYSHPPAAERLAALPAAAA